MSDLQAAIIQSLADLNRATAELQRRLDDQQAELISLRTGRRRWPAPRDK